MQNQYVWASKINCKPCFFFPLGPLSHRDSKYFTYVHHWTWFRIAREHLQETSGNHGLLWPLYDNSKICQALKSSPQFLAKSLSPCQPPKWFFWNVSEQEWAFTTRNGSFNTKKCLTFFFLRVYFVGLLMPSPDALVSAATFELPIECSSARGSRFVMPAMQVPTPGRAHWRNHPKNGFSFQFRNV